MPSSNAHLQFIYDPHLAPIIDALIAQHWEPQRQRRDGYEPIPVAMTMSPTSGGRSSAIDCGQQRVSRRRRPTDMFELDDTRVIPDERMPGSPRRSQDTKRRHDQPPPLTMPMRHQRYPEQYEFGKELRPPPAAMVQPVPMHQPIPRRPDLPSPVHLINMEAMVPDPVKSEPTAKSHTTPQDSAPPATVRETPDQAEEVVLRRPSRPSSRSTIMNYPVPERRASPALSIASMTSASHTSVVSSHLGADDSIGDDVEVISLSGTTTSYVDAETYTPRTPLTPSTPLSRAMSPPVHVHAETTFQPIALSRENLNLAALQMPVPVTAPSVSSWGEDEHWRSDSEWDALSDAN